MRLWLRGLWVFLLMLSVGCAMLEPSRTELKPSANDFSQRLRWADYQGAARHLATRRQEAFTNAVIARGPDLKIVEAHFEAERPSGDAAARSMTLFLEYYLLPSTEIQTTRIALDWVYLDYGWSRPGIWLIDSDFPPLR